MNQSDLADLVDNPRETLDIEIKAWLDLRQPELRASVAKHMCALANHGGGYVVYGFTDDLEPQDPPDDLSCYNRDFFNSISKKYLTPAPHCEVSTVTSSAGRTHKGARHRSTDLLRLKIQRRVPRSWDSYLRHHWAPGRLAP